MNILTQTLSNLNTNKLFTNFIQSIEKLICPIELQTTSSLFDELMNRTSSFMHHYIQSILVNAIEKADLQFRNSPFRIERYYVNSTRYRSMITPFGEITFKRATYRDRSTKEMFCYIDRKLALLPRQRYHTTVAALAYKAYADHNSMIKVGKVLANHIHAHYNSVSDDIVHAIPRQTIRTMINRFQAINSSITPAEQTPETLYIMVDEKYIATQGNNRKKHMSKLAVIFEDCVPVEKKDGTPYKNRNRLINKTYVSSLKGNVWEDVLDVLCTKYDMDKVKQIYILGDGPPWISHGCSDLSFPNTKTTFLINRFHFMQNINRITTSVATREILISYIRANKKAAFKKK